MREMELEARDLELWRGDRRLFSGVSLKLSQGELLHVVGPNGIGKTSLLRTICGLTQPETGTITWNGADIVKDRESFHSELAFIGHADGLKDELNALENLRFDLGLRQTISGRQISEGLTALAIDEVTAGLPARQLSAGQRRRVALTRILLSRARFWVLDEPYSHLDHAGRDQVDRALEKHLAGDGCAMMTSHQDVSLRSGVIKELRLP